MFQRLKAQIASCGGFRQWFVNVFWYHHKWKLLVGVGVAALIIYITVASMGGVKYDAYVVVGTNRAMPEEAMEPLRVFLQDALGDVNGDGQCHVQLELLNFNDPTFSGQMQERFYLCATEAEYVVYLLNDERSSLYTAEGMEYFQPLADYGIEPDADNPLRRSLADCEVLQELTLADDIYLCISDFGAVTRNPEDIERTQTCLRMARALVGMNPEVQ